MHSNTYKKREKRLTFVECLLDDIKDTALAVELHRNSYYNGQAEVEVHGCQCRDMGHLKKTEDEILLSENV